MKTEKIILHRVWGLPDKVLIIFKCQYNEAGTVIEHTGSSTPVWMLDKTLFFHMFPMRGRLQALVLLTGIYKHSPHVGRQESFVFCVERFEYR